MAPVSSRKDKTTPDKHPHAAWSYGATRYPPILPHGMAIRYPSAMEHAQNNILQTTTTSTPPHRNQTQEKRRMPGLRKINDLPTGCTLRGVALHPEYYNRDQQQHQKEVSLNMNIPRTQPHHENNSASPNVHNSYFGNACGCGCVLPNLSSDPMNTMYHKNKSATSGLFNQASSVIADPRHSTQIPSHSFNYPRGQLPSTHYSSPLYTPTDRRNISHSNLQDNNSGRPGNVKSVEKFAGAQSNARTASYSFTRTDQMQKSFNFDPQLAEQLSTQLVREYLNYLICNGYQFHVSRAQHFLTLNYPHFNGLANALNDLAKIMFTTHKTPQKIIMENMPAAARASVKPSPPFDQNIVPVSQAFETQQNLHHRHFAGGSVINGQNMMVNAASFSTQPSPNLFNSTQTPQNSTFNISSRNMHHVMTEPVPTLKISNIADTNNMNRRPPLQGVTKKSVQQKYSNLAKQIPYSVAQNISSIITTAYNQPLTHLDLPDESQNVLEHKINTMRITTKQPIQSNQHTREEPIPLPEMKFSQNEWPQKTNADQVAAVVYENEGLIISYPNPLNAANQECKAGENLRTILSSINQNTLELKSTSNNSQVEVNTGTDNSSILPSTNNSDSKHEPSLRKTHDTNIKVIQNEKDLPPVHKRAPEHSSSNKPQIDVGLNCIEKILPSSNNSAIELKSLVESNINVPILPTTYQNASEGKSPNQRQVEGHVANSNEKSIPESDTDSDAIDTENPIMPENQSLEQEPITEEEFLDEFTSLLNQLDSHNSSTNELFERLRGIITKSTETADSLKKVFSDSLETSDDTVTSTTSSEPV